LKFADIARQPNAQLVLEDGRVFVGRRFGAETDGIGEVVFNTSMTGYQEILSDPSYAGQMVVMTYPLIGNYGIATEDFESRQLFLTGLVVKEASRFPSNWRHKHSLGDYLKTHGIPGIEGLDTRALVRHLRTHGAMRGVIGDIRETPETLVICAKTHPSMAGCDLASVVTKNERFEWREGRHLLNIKGSCSQQGGLFDSPQFKVVAVDFGIKWNILRCLIDSGCNVVVVPAAATADDILSLKPDGVLLSNGPGDPDPVQYAVRTIRDLIGKAPIFGICLGHQLLAIAAGGKTYKLKFGHRGGNHPVIDLQTRKVEITSHNHGFSVDPDSLGPSGVEITHINLNDQTLEGFSLRNAPAFGIQYHPEASPGPHDALYMFNRFADLMRSWQNGSR